VPPIPAGRFFKKRESKPHLRISVRALAHIEEK
jgi:hypothetical protein